MQHWLRFFTIGLFLSQTAWAQGIRFETGTWSDVLKRASQENKLIFVHFDPNPAVCQQCIDVASQGFNNPALREKFGFYFLSYRLPYAHPDRRQVAEQYEAYGAPMSIYLDASGNLLFRQPGSTSFALAYLDNAERALQEQHQTPLSELARAYDTNPSDRAALENLIRKRQVLGYSYGDLLDTYADLTGGQSAPPDALAFMFEREPAMHTKAFTAVFGRSGPLVDSLYRRVGEKRSVDIDKQIILKSRQEAIQRRNPALAMQTAQFAARAHGQREQTGQAGYRLNLMEYYRAVRDTTSFLRMAADYFDGAYMTQAVDSLLNADKTAMVPGSAPHAVTIPAAAPKPSRQNFPESFVYRPPSQEVANELNRGAYMVYQMGRTPADWERALGWSQRSLVLWKDNATFMDTSAHLLYRLNRRDEAIQTQQRAIEAAPATRMSSVQLEVELAKMQQGTL
ncbi:MAG: hypothetical protein H7Z72_19270 [Bacteroidetes bacterium]|nr:hypothetical protein [Fibrella sp.]